MENVAASYTRDGFVHTENREKSTFFIREPFLEKTETGN